ncbi:cell division protein ZapA [Virgibacillus sp. MSJ-26]|uniref:cell division protein ZapA n=1 Tax=Virgibacillus sp. MSJ-26 TaxID=2841522 RepID=UPI001C1030AD|nr:cell division protein ZapA [Virgibacillus sp. MSJ-26]
MSHNEKTRVSIKIYNRSYTVVGEESPSDVQLVASLVDQKMREIKENNSNLDVADLAVLTAVNTMNDYMKLKEDYATLLGTLKKKEDN